MYAGQRDISAKNDNLAKAGSNKICAKAGSNKMEVTKRLVDTAARYIMECYQEVERQLEDMEAGQVLRLDPSINSNIFNNIEPNRIEQY